MYKNFDIDAFDHSEFLFDEEDKREGDMGDIKAQTYHDLVHTLKFLNVTTLVTSNDTYVALNIHKAFSGYSISGKYFKYCFSQ